MASKKNKVTDEAVEGTKFRRGERTDALVDEIIDRLSDGEPLRQICRDDHMPSWKTVYRWIDDDSNLSSRIAHARELGEEAISQDCLRIADTPVIGETEETSENGIKIKREDMLGHRKLQIETRLKLLAKWNPKKWGDKQTIDMTVNESLAERLARAKQRNGNES